MITFFVTLLLVFFEDSFLFQIPNFSLESFVRNLTMCPSADDKLLSAAEMGFEGEEEDEEDFAVKIINKKGRLRWREGSERIFDWKEAG